LNHSEIGLLLIQGIIWNYHLYVGRN